MKQITVLTDFSRNSKAVAQAAVDVAKQCSANLHFLHVHEEPLYRIPDLLHEYYSDSKVTDYLTEKMNLLISDIQNSGVEISHTILTGSRLSETLEHEVVQSSDLLVIGSSGDNEGIVKLLLGNNAERIIRNAPCPVLTINAEREHFVCNDIVFASVFDGFASTTFDNIREFALAFNATIHLLYVSTPGKFFKPTEEANELMGQFAKKWWLENYTLNHVNDHEWEMGIRSFANRKEVDLIAMTTHLETSIRHMFAGSTAEDVANSTRLPVLTTSTNESIFQNPLYRSPKRVEDPLFHTRLV